MKKTNLGPTAGVNGGDEGGEGNYDASRRYREGLEKSVQKGNAHELGEKAKEALAGKEGVELRRADERGKRADIPHSATSHSATPRK